jgi:hypothetical protein
VPATRLTAIRPWTPARTAAFGSICMSASSVFPVPGALAPSAVILCLVSLGSSPWGKLDRKQRRQSITAVVAACLTLAWGALALWFVHVTTADDLSSGCSGGGCEGFPSSAWPETWTILGWWVAINELVLVVAAGVRVIHRRGQPP